MLKSSFTINSKSKTNCANRTKYSVNLRITILTTSSLEHLLFYFRMIMKTDLNSSQDGYKIYSHPLALKFI